MLSSMFCDCIEVALDRVLYRVTMLRRDDLDVVDRVDMDFVLVPAICYFFTGDENKSFFLAESLEFGECLQSHFPDTVTFTNLDPAGLESFFDQIHVLLRKRKASGFRDWMPAFTLLHHIVIRQDKKVVIMVDIPGHYLVRGCITIAPVGVRVCVAPVPFFLGLAPGEQHPQKHDD